MGSVNWLAVVGDALWILCLSFMAGASRTAASRIPAGTNTPALILGGSPLVRTSRTLALALFPVAATGVGLILSAFARTPQADPSAPLMLFGLRMLLAPLAVVAHLTQLRAALNLLQSEGKLDP